MYAASCSKIPLIFFFAVTKCLSGEAFTSAMCLLSFFTATIDLERLNNSDIALQGKKNAENKGNSPTTDSYASVQHSGGRHLTRTWQTNVLRTKSSFKEGFFQFCTIINYSNIGNKRSHLSSLPAERPQPPLQSTAPPGPAYFPDEGPASHPRHGQLQPSWNTNERSSPAFPSPWPASIPQLLRRRGAQPVPAAAEEKLSPEQPGSAP